MYISVRFGSFFAILSFLFVFLFLRTDNLFLMLWPAFSFLVVSMGYLGLGPKVFCKRTDGRLRVSIIILLAPYFLLLHISWIFARRLRVNLKAFDSLDHKLFIGRRLLNRECPKKITVVVDLTAEFSEVERLRSSTLYLAVPTLDTMPPPKQLMLKTLRILDTVDGLTLIHCAEGYGRTTTFTAALLLYRGRASSVDEALEQVITIRPTARISTQQRAFLDAFALSMSLKRI